MGDITLQQVEAVCGNYTHRSGNNYFFQCPICLDSHKDNLVYNSSRQIIKCFSDDGTHTLQVLDMINRKFNSERCGIVHKPLSDNNFSVKQPQQEPIWIIRQGQYCEYAIATQQILLQHEELLSYLKKKRGWNKETIELCGVGFDHTENCFTIPICSVKHNCITDFELRLYGEKKIRRIGGGCATIAEVYGPRHADDLYVVEGFVDGVTLTQFLLEKKQTSFTVYSCSNGVTSLLNVFNEINFDNFKTIKLMLDNDSAGDDMTNKIVSQYSFVIDSRKFLKESNCKDFTEWYIKR